MEEQDLFIQIFSDVPEVNCNFFIDGRNISTTSNAISEAMEYRRKHKIYVAGSTNITIKLSTEVKFAKLLQLIS